jgi:hypothetical protein
MSETDDIENVLAEVVVLGDMPTQRELELGEAVRHHISNRHKAEQEDRG